MIGPSFPAGFRFGVATSAQQIEGAAREDGRGESVWDHCAAKPGFVKDRSDASRACDHYHRWRDDIALMRELGISAYRFSTGWSRVLPTGEGAPNEAGLAFYDRLVDGLLEAGITPFLTLDHWDLPQALDEKGGWGSRATVDAFVAYADVVSRRLGDRVKHWITHNEPWCVATLGHELGAHAPGRRDPAEALRVAHHLLLSHGRAVPVLRANSAGCEAGLTTMVTHVEPASTSAEDRDAARRLDGSFNRWFLDPLHRGAYPADAVADRVRRGHLASAEIPFVHDGDLRTIAVPADFLGINYYSRAVVKAGPDGEPVGVPQAPPEQLTEMGWEVWPQGFFDVLTRLTRDYAPKQIHVTENGAAFADPPASDGVVADPRRVDYLRTHLLAAQRAIEAGVPLAGYFAWSLMDNWEWAEGYTKRFGLYAVDFESQQRTAKHSARFYRDVVAAHAVPTVVPQYS
ncbi:MAG: beta-glucosidase [Candidatus Eisenbacteria bacterium]|uniref:Beta-glucosidase n=1 Tax=Eiseniibacteriota bacterium TaxID=2212470 RepID=A0A933S9F1_UNCEI|nr:beta-glucosidase [Candidatus Eisenbacteria bacterium]